MLRKGDFLFFFPKQRRKGFEGYKTGEYFCNFQSTDLWKVAGGFRLMHTKERSCFCISTLPRGGRWSCGLYGPECKDRLKAIFSTKGYLIPSASLSTLDLPDQDRGHGMLVSSQEDIERFVLYGPAKVEVERDMSWAVLRIWLG